LYPHFRNVKILSTMEKAIVTGGAGFIGSHLAEGLVKNGWRVTVIDDLATGKLENIKHLQKDIEFIQGSITDLSLLKKQCKNTDCVFHLAALSSVPRSITDPVASHEVNATGTLNVLLAAVQNNVKKLVFASSAAVYGDIPTLPVKEDMLPRPKSPYAVNKLTGEYYCAVFQNVSRLPAVCLRYFNVYGPRQDPTSEYAAVIPKFIQSALEGKPLVIYGDGEQTRDFAFAQDVVEANILAARRDVTGVFNISGGAGITINNLAGLIIKLTGGKSKIVYEKPRPGDIVHSLADITRAGTFGYKPAYTMESGLAETIKYFQKARF